MILVDTSVWSLALRSDHPSSHPEVLRLTEALEGGEEVFTTGLVIQELLQGFEGPRPWQAIIARLSVLPPARSELRRPPCGCRTAEQVSSQRDSSRDDRRATRATLYPTRTFTADHRSRLRQDQHGGPPPVVSLARSTAIVSSSLQPSPSANGGCSWAPLWLQ